MPKKLPLGGLRRAFANSAFGNRSKPTPAPPRTTSLLSNLFGLQAKPSCGAKFFKLLSVRFFRVEITAPVNPPVGPKVRFPITPLLGVMGENHSHRKPKFKVTFGRNFQSSCPNNPKSPVWNLVLFGVG